MRLWRWLTQPQTPVLTCHEGGDHDYEWVTLGGYSAPSLDVLMCRWCGAEGSQRVTQRRGTT